MSSSFSFPVRRLCHRNAASALMATNNSPQLSHLQTGVSGSGPQTRVVRVALCGNPNIGKSTIFNRLTGLRQKVANYAGVTVETHTGAFTTPDRPDVTFEITDVPGCYSLSALSPDEFIATRAIIGRSDDGVLAPPDLIVVTLDASTLARSLYLLAQVADAGRPMVAVLNLVDVAESKGIRVNPRKLSVRLRMPVVSTVASKGRGIEKLREVISRFDTIPPAEPIFSLGPQVDTFVAEELGTIASAHSQTRPELIRAIFDRHGPAEERFLRLAGPVGRERLEELRRHLAEEHRGLPFAEAYPLARAMAEIARDVIVHARRQVSARSDRIDGVILHRVWGPLILCAVMALMFQAIFSWAAPAMAVIGAGMTWMGGVLGTAMAPGPLESLLVDGVIGGVGAVVIFLPQILILFFFLGLLEDSGYLPRAAFIVDRLFRWCGLSGKSFVPLLSSFACAIPAVMATRVIEDRRQRFLTILVAPLLTCSARLPVYALFIGAFVPLYSVGGVFNSRGLTLLGLYALGVVVALLVSLVLSRTILRGKRETFVMELPTYKLPTLRNIWIRMSLASSSFLKRAGTVILALTIIVWAASYYPRNPALERAHQENLASINLKNTPDEVRGRLAQAERASFNGTIIRNSYLGQIGVSLEPFFAPLGWDWRITIAALASFPAREVVVATLGAVYNLGDDVDESSASLVERMRESRWESGPRTGEPVFGPSVALSIMVFFALCCQCLATVAVIRRETHSTGWAVFTFAYMTTLAYFGAWATFAFCRSVGVS